MKKLRKFALNLDRGCWGNDYGYNFYLRSRCLCNFIERRFKKEKIELVDSTKLVITGSNVSKDNFYINSSKIACYTVPFDKSLYDKQKINDDVHKFIIQFAKNNLQLLPRSKTEGVNSTLELIKEFENNGYKNQWTHQKKSYRKYKMIATLDCSLTLDAFELKLNISCNDTNTFSKVILHTDPDEIAFHYGFKDIRIEDNMFLVTSRVDKPLLQIPLEELGINKKT